MPPKQKQKQKQTSKQKQQVKQVVNVRVGEIKAKRKSAPRRRASLPEPVPPLLRQGPPVNVSLSTQSYMPSQPSYINEYNTLLKQMAEEKAVQARAAPPLAANTTPLTINQQRNEMLNRVEAAMQTNPLAVPLKNIVESETYDDPLTNENMFVNSSRLAENIAPKLPVTNFDYNDIDKYDAENQTEQNALVDSATQTTRRDTFGKQTKKELLNQTNALIRYYNAETNDNKKLVKQNISREALKLENERITDLILSRGLKISKMK